MNNISALFFKSFCSVSKASSTIQNILDWVNLQNEAASVEIEQIAFSELRQWSFLEGALRHESGRFFSVEGLHVEINDMNWQQPIINQPEIGYLGFITKEINGVLHFLIQAKIEPGNINAVQLSPTLQATKSNYSLVHQGISPAYLEYFEKVDRKNVLVDQLQSEHNSRFVKKRNRNIIIKVEEDIEILENFMWVTLGQIKELMNIDNLINMNTRSVVANIPLQNILMEEIMLLQKYEDKLTQFGLDILQSMALNSWSLNSVTNIQHFITKKKASTSFHLNKIPLKFIKDWDIDKNKIYNTDNSFFEIIAAYINISNREVQSWTQPLIKPVQPGLSCFIVKKINGVLHFIVQAKIECGCFDIVELGPTVQTSTRGNNSIFNSTIHKANFDNIIFDSYQSEEGGRFFHEENRNMIIMAGKNFNEELPDDFIWMTLHQLLFFANFSNMVNIQARSLLAAVYIN